MLIKMKYKQNSYPQTSEKRFLSPWRRWNLQRPDGWWDALAMLNSHYSSPSESR